MRPKTFSRLERLRAGTRDAHARVETVPALARLLAPDLTREEYVAVLRHMHAFLARAEPDARAALEPLPEAAALLDGTRPRVLAEDLAWFGATPIAPPRLSGPDGPAAALGALYVIVGSGLGGRVIARHLADSLGVAPGAGGGFYGGLTAEAARRQWHRLTALLEDDIIDGLPPGTGGCVEASMLQGARATFGALDDWTRRIPVAARGGHAAAEAVAP